MAQIKNIYTMQDWERDGTLKVKVGQIIEPEVFYQLLNCVPPHYWAKGFFQVGEPSSFDFTSGKQTYQTYEKVNEDDYYKYIGNRTSLTNK